MRSQWPRKLDEECPHQVVLPRRPLVEEHEIMKFLDSYVCKCDMHVEDEYAVFVRYCFADPADAAVFRSRFEQKSDRFKLTGSHDGSPSSAAGPSRGFMVSQSSRPARRRPHLARERARRERRCTER
jgi:hypothetical protein